MNAVTKFEPILEGEILEDAPWNDIKVFVQIHPFSATKKEFIFPAGTSLQEIDHAIRDKAIARVGYVDMDVRIMGEIIYPELWAKVRPKPGTVVTFRRRPSGFIAAIIGGISAAFSSLGSFIGGLGFIGKLLMSGLSLALKFLINKLFAPKQPEKLPDAKTSYSITTTKNQTAPWAPVPVVLGKHRIAPFYGADPYTEMSGDDQYLRVLFVWGYGPLDITDIKIGETPIGDFEDVQIETYYGYPGDPTPTLYPNQVIEEALSIDLEDTDWQSRTTADNIQEIAIDLILPNGLVRINGDGNHSQTVYVEWRYKLVGAGAWTDAPDITITAKTRDAIRKTYRATVAEGQYDVEVRRSVAKKDYGDGTSDIQDLFWTAVRGFRPGVPVTFSDPVAVTALRIKATSQLNGSLDTFNGICTSKVRAWTGVTWASNTLSQNPADLFLWVLQGPANKKPVPDSLVDFDTLVLWHNYCVTKGWKFNMVRVDRASVWETILDICVAGRAVPVFRDGKWSVIWDEVSEDIVQLFTPRNSWGFEATRVFQNPPHGYRIRFVNEDKDYVEDERIVYDDGYNEGNATIFEQIDLPGITDKDAIWKHGRYHIAANRLRPEVYSIMTDFENLICTRGDRIRIQHDIMLVGLMSGRIHAVDSGTQTVTVDEWLDLLGDVQYMMRFRLSDGTFLERNVVFGTVGELQEIPLVGVDDLPEVGDLFTFGTLGNDSAIYRVLSIEPANELAAKIQFVDDAPEILDADTGTIPVFDSHVSAPMDPLSIAPSGLSYQAGIYLQEGVQYFGYINLKWKQARQGNIVNSEIQILKDGLWSTAGLAPGYTTQFEIRNLLGGTYEVRVRALYNDNTNSGWLTSDVIDIGAIISSAAPNVTGLRISSIGDTSTLSWNSVGIASEKYEIRFSPVTIGAADWNAATQLIPETGATSVQVPTMIGTYFVKAFSPVAAKSAIAAKVYTNVLAILGLNAVQTLDEDPGFAGGKTQCIVSSGALKLADFQTGKYLKGLYRFAHSLDLADAYTSRLSATIDAFGEDIHNHMHDWATLSSVSKLSSTEPDSWRVYLEFRTTLGSPVDTVTRTGTATAVGPDGYLVTYVANQPRYLWDKDDLMADPVLQAEATGSTNLVLKPEDFSDAAWSKTNVTVTADASKGPDGSVSMDKMVETAVSGQHRLITTSTITVTSGQPLTVSVYAKAAERSMFLLCPYSGGAGTYFDLATQTKVDAGCTSTIEHFKDDIYRCTVTLASAPGTTASPQLYLATALNVGGLTYLGIVTDGMHFWGCQLEQKAAATSYIPTGTNLLTWSEDFSNAAWADPLGIWSVTTNNAPSPDGLNNADTVSFDSGVGPLRQAVTLTNGATYTFSIWARKVSGAATGFTVDLGDGAPATISPDSVLRRYSVTLVAGVQDWVDIGWTATGVFEFWGAQLETGPSVSSYIPTAGTSVTMNSRGVETVTFAADWSAWQEFVVGDVTFRAIQFRLQMVGKANPDPDIEYTTVTPNVLGLSVQVDMPDRVIAVEDITVPIGGLSVLFDPPFLGLAGIATADQDMATGDRKVITAKDENGFTIQYFNSVGTSISRVMDYVAKGYGRKHT